MSYIYLSYMNDSIKTKEAKTKYGSIVSMCIPNGQFNDVAKEYLLNRSGIYFLLNSPNIYADDFSIYVGKSNSLGTRVNGPHKNKQHEDIPWSYTLVFFRDDLRKQLNSDEISYLERKTYLELQKNGFGGHLKNAGVPSGTNQLDPMDVQDIISGPLREIEIYADALGFPLFFMYEKMLNETDDRDAPDDRDEDYSLDVRGAKGLGRYIGDGKRFQVERGSKITSLAPAPSYQARYPRIKEYLRHLIDKGIINDELVFIRDYDFSSPSQAARLLILREINGLKGWGIE